MRLAVLLSLLAGGWYFGPAAAAWLEAIVRERSQRLVQRSR
ncbi:MAG TPA: hypothetical protein VD972_17010 [Hyalangium sp.]|nr:hypothetical protein [Hyalangium sp.]